MPARATVTLVASPAAGSIFTGWTGDCVGTSQAASLTMSAAHSCTATFSPGVARLPFPQMPSHGQPPLSRLQLVTITFAGSPNRSFVESFGDFVVSSQWLTDVTTDFGPIPATHLAKVVLPASSGSPDYAALVLANIGAALPYPADPTGLLYLFYAPSPCAGGGYHSTVTYNGKPVAYAVSLNCNDSKAAEAVASHEIGEVLTDPYLSGEFFDASTAPWVGENGDICNSSPWWIEGGFRFEPVWSNTAAASGGSPCVPWAAAGHTYVNVSPSPSAPQKVAAGSSVVITLTGWSTAMTAAWPLSVGTDNYAQQDFDSTPSLSAGTIANGTTVQLTLHVPPGTPSGRSATLRVHSTLPDLVDGLSFSGDWSLQIIAQ